MNQVDEISIGIAQLTSTDSIEGNMEVVSTLIENQFRGSDWCFFPENTLYFRINETDTMPYFELGGPELKKLSEVSIRCKTNIHLGSLPLNHKGVRSSASIILTSKGEIIHSYSKSHLFDIQLLNQNPILESSQFTRGIRPSMFSYRGWVFGQSICCDIRFSELFRLYAESAVDVMLIPSAFLKTTGEAHWHILNRARAIESQCYIISSAQAGLHKSLKYPSSVRETYGHSLVVDPWGQILVDLKNNLKHEVLVLKKESLKKVRQQIPMADHRHSNFREWSSKIIKINS